jgi:hypothetical protein
VGDPCPPGSTWGYRTDTVTIAQGARGCRLISARGAAEADGTERRSSRCFCHRAASLLRAREATLRTQIDALDGQLADRQVYLKLADDLEGFLAGLCATADTADVLERQRVLRLLVKDVLVGPQKITIRHRIPVREHTPGSGRDRVC